MTGTRLEASNHIVLAAIPAIQNIRKSVERAGFKVSQYILQPIASCSSVLEESEKDLGDLLIDIGGGTTDIAILHKKAIKHSKVFGVAGNQVTNDIRESLGIVTQEAEILKKQHGYATDAAIIRDEEISIRGVGAKASAMIPISLLTQIISLRMRELFTLIDNDIRSVGLKNKIKAGIVLTGGGSMLRGCTELAEEVFGIPCRIGIPLEFSTGAVVEMEKPEFATVVGLIKGIPGQKVLHTTNSTQKKKSKKKKNIVKESWTRFRDFFNEL
jgi:cell division protein FtsA